MNQRNRSMFQKHNEQGLKANPVPHTNMDNESFVNIETILFKSCSIKPNPFIAKDHRFKERK